MIINKFLLILFLFFFNSLVFSQKDSIEISSLWIKTTPLHYLDPYNGTNYNIGLEYRLNEKISMNTEFGKIFVWSPNNDHHGFFVRHEIKKYLSLRTDREMLYFSGELSYSNQTFTRTDEIYFSNDTSYLKTYFTERNFIGLSGLFGSVREYDCGFIFEIMAGFGLRYNMVTNDLTEQESEGRELGDWTTPTNYLIKKGNHIIPRFHLGIKVGWRICK
jgi:hypothetical protein